jgi:hypothetical protein
MWGCWPVPAGPPVAPAWGLLEAGQLPAVLAPLPGRQAAACPGRQRLGGTGQVVGPVGLIPGDQVHGGELAKAEQVVGGLPGGDTQLVAELLASVERDLVQWWDTGDRGGVVRAEELGAEPREVPEQGTGDLVAVDLVTGQHQRARPAQGRSRATGRWGTGRWRGPGAC